MRCNDLNYFYILLSGNCSFQLWKLFERNYWSSRKVEIFTSLQHQRWTIFQKPSLIYAYDFLSSNHDIVGSGWPRTLAELRLWFLNIWPTVLFERLCDYNERDRGQENISSVKLVKFYSESHIHVIFGSFWVT